LEIKLFFFIPHHHQDFYVHVLQQQLSILENTISVFWCRTCIHNGGEREKIE